MLFAFLFFFYFFSVRKISFQKKSIGYVAFFKTFYKIHYKNLCIIVIAPPPVAD